MDMPAAESKRLKKKVMSNILSDSKHLPADILLGVYAHGGVYVA